MNEELYEKVMQLQWLLQNQQMRSFAEGSHLADTSRGQGRILAALKLRDEISTKDLAYLLGLTVASLNELLAKLVKSGHITRKPSELDRRVLLVKLTEKGRNEEQPAAQTPSDIFGCLSDDEQETLNDFLDRIIDALQADLIANDDDMSDRFHAIFEARERLFAEMGGRDGRGFNSNELRGGFANFFSGRTRNAGFRGGRDNNNDSRNERKNNDKQGR